MPDSSLRYSHVILFFASAESPNLSFVGAVELWYSTSLTHTKPHSSQSVTGKTTANSHEATGVPIEPLSPRCALEAKNSVTPEESD